MSIVDDFRVARSAQVDRAESVCGGYAAETADWFGRGGNVAVESPLTFKETLQARGRERAAELETARLEGWLDDAQPTVGASESVPGVGTPEGFELGTFDDASLTPDVTLRMSKADLLDLTALGSLAAKRELGRRAAKRAAKRATFSA